MMLAEIVGANVPRSRLVVLLLVALAGPAFGASDASVPASATVLVPELPSRKSDLKELKLAFGRDPAGEIRAEIEGELRDLQAFETLQPEGGDFRLQVQVLSVSRELRERGGRAGESPDEVLLSAEATGSWFRGETPLATKAVTLSRRIPLADSVLRNEIQSAFRSIFREVGERSFAELYETQVQRGSSGSKGAGR